MVSIYGKERPLFLVALIFSILFWLALIVGTFGIALIYLAVGFIAYLFVQSAFISWLRGNGVRITPQQFPKLYAQYEHCCRTLGISPKPEVFLVNSEGMLNALATKFLGDHFIVLYSEIVEALEDRPEALNFYIGHELGHVKQRHLNWGPVLWPGMLLPHLGTAYSRAREYTCDLYGLKCCAQREDAERALAVLASGDSLWKQLDLEQFRLQTAQTGGFWMSFHEYTADYPWLVKRLEHVRATYDNRPRELPRRSVFAFLLACLVPRFGAGAGGGLAALILIMIIGIMAAVAVPAYQEYMQRAAGLQGLESATAYDDSYYADEQPGIIALTDEDYAAQDLVEQAMAETWNAQRAMLEYFEMNEQWPETLEEAGYTGPTSSELIAEMYIDGDLDLFVVLAPPPLEGSTFYFTPNYDAAEGMTLMCVPFEIAEQHVPASCQ